MDEIIKKLDKEIQEAEVRFNQEFNRSYEVDSGKNDATHRNVQKLERKVNHLAKSVYDLFTAFDENNKVENGAGAGAAGAGGDSRQREAPQVIQVDKSRRNASENRWKNEWKQNRENHKGKRSKLFEIQVPVLGLREERGGENFLTHNTSHVQI